MLRTPFPRTSALFLGFFGRPFAQHFTVAMMDGSPSAIWKPFDRPGAEYFSDVPAVKGVGSFLHGYVQNRERIQPSHAHPSAGRRDFPLFGGTPVGAGNRPCRLGGRGDYCNRNRAVLSTGTPAGLRRISPSPCTQGEGWGGGRISTDRRNPHPGPPPEYQGRGNPLPGNRTLPHDAKPRPLRRNLNGRRLSRPALWSIYFLQRTISGRGFAYPIAAGFALTISLIFSYVTVCIGVMMLIYAVLELAESPKQLAASPAPWPFAQS